MYFACLFINEYIFINYLYIYTASIVITFDASLVIYKISCFNEIIAENKSRHSHFYLLVL